MSDLRATMVEASSLARHYGKYCPTYIMFVSHGIWFDGLVAACHLLAGHEGQHESAPFVWEDGKAGRG